MPDKLSGFPRADYGEEEEAYTELVRIRKYIRENPEKAKLPVGRFSLYRADWLDD
ncbi:hypothetical protein [Pontiella desulfatans]|uniref:hypothetical protein n=1 Tax=Pontiella desulfatans TaxID=2750659 RepID=UPI001444302E|nr:hypothetical protein [Pontiella desulfatans]